MPNGYENMSIVTLAKILKEEAEEMEHAKSAEKSVFETCKAIAQSYQQTVMNNELAMRSVFTEADICNHD